MSKRQAVLMRIAVVFECVMASLNCGIRENGFVWSFRILPVVSLSTQVLRVFAMFLLLHYPTSLIAVQGMVFAEFMKSTESGSKKRRRDKFGPYFCRGLGYLRGCSSTDGPVSERTV